jgi:hypothetical protein
VSYNNESVIRCGGDQVRLNPIEAVECGKIVESPSRSDQLEKKEEECFQGFLEDEE